MAVGFEVDTDVVTFGSVVQILDTGRHACNGNLLLEQESAMFKVILS